MSQNPQPSGHLDRTRDAWAARWPEALAAWSKFTKLKEPTWCLSREQAAAEGLTDSFAMIRLQDQAVVINIAEVVEHGLEDFPVEIMAHEIGHHVYCPADMSDQARMIARMRRALPTKEHLAGFISNLYTDLLINDRLQRGANLRMGGVYKTLGGGSADRMWAFYMRVYEILWSLPRATLAAGAHGAKIEADAQLGARVVRAFARDWLKGSGRFAALCFPYLLEKDGEEMQKILRPLLDTKSAGAGGSIEGLTEIEPGEEEDAIHPSLDEELSGVAAAAADEPAADESGSPNPIGAEREGGGKSRRQYREPFEYGEILKSLDANLSDHEIAVRYYRELAIPHLIRFPVRETFEMTEPLAEGLETWDAGSPLESVDWFESAVVSPHVVPGFTTVQRTYGTSPGALPERRPLDLYLGIDCSGSMANPQRNLSYPVLAGTIIAVSALRAGAKVLATLSGEPGRSVSTDGFVSNESAVLELLTGYLGTGYAFGIHRLVETFRATKPPPRPVHILIITDHDIFSMLDQTYEGTGGWEIARRSLETAAGGGTYVLHMRRDWNDAQTARMTADGWNVSNVENLEDMVAFARGFSKENYARKVTPPGGKKAGV